MKALKITLALVLLLAVFTSCTKQELNEDEVLLTTKTIKPIGGVGKD